MQPVKFIRKQRKKIKQKKKALPMNKGKKKTHIAITFLEGRTGGKVDESCKDKNLEGNKQSHKKNTNTKKKIKSSNSSLFYSANSLHCTYSRFSNHASRRPTFPKQTQLQNSTLQIHVETPTLSTETRPATKPPVDALAEAAEKTGSGAWIICGFVCRRTAVPAMPTAAENQKPARVRSTRYQRKGLTRASVSETCSVDCQGSLRLVCVSLIQFMLGIARRKEKRILTIA